MLKRGLCAAPPTDDGKTQPTTASFEALLTTNGKDAAEIKRCYLKLARVNHPDANKDDPTAAERFVLLGRTYENLQKKLSEGKSLDDRNQLDEEDDDEEEDYGEEEARSTFSAAGGPVLTREMRRELKKVSEQMASGGVRDGGWFGFAQQYGGDDGVRDLPGGPDLKAGPQLQLADGKKPRRKRK